MDDRRIRQVGEILSGSVMPVAFTGAGISAESGIPTFRDKDGLWQGYDVSKVATPEGFAENPRLVWRFYNERREEVERVSPNAGHLALAELESLHGNFVVITQNIDGLHQQAGSRNVIELHGSLFKASCVDCGYIVGIGEVAQEVMSCVPVCPRCSGMLRPAVVWFNESLPEEEFSSAVEAVDSCDLLFSIGTSAAVYPAASLIWQAKSHGAVIVEINPQETAASGIADICLRGNAGEILPRIVESYKARG